MSRNPGLLHIQNIPKVSHNRVYIYTPHTTVYLMVSLPKVPSIHRVYRFLVNLANFTLAHTQSHTHADTCLHKYKPHTRLHSHTAYTHYIHTHARTHALAVTHTHIYSHTHTSTLTLRTHTTYTDARTHAAPDLPHPRRCCPQPSLPPFSSCVSHTCSHTHNTHTHTHTHTRSA